MDNSYLTQIDDNYPTCERTKAVLRIHCGSRSPSSISALLQVVSSDIVEAGLPRKSRRGYAGPLGKVNLWMLDSEANVLSKDLRRHLDWLLDQLEPASGQIRELRKSGVVIDIWCVWWSKTGEGGPALWPEQMCRIARLDLELSIGFSYYGDEDSLDEH